MDSSLLVIINKIGLLPKAVWKQPSPPTKIVLHDTAGPTLSGAESTLKQRGLGYHYMIDRDGKVYQYYKNTDAVNHAYGANKLTIGISLVGGGGTKLLPIQVDACKALMLKIKNEVPSVKQFTSHKECDPRKQKIDPEFKPSFEDTMNSIASYTGLERTD